MSKKMSRKAKELARQKIWVKNNIAALNPKHEQYLAKGYSFLHKSTRFYQRKDGLSIRIIYRKTELGCKAQISSIIRLAYKRGEHG